MPKLRTEENHGAGRHGGSKSRVSGVLMTRAGERGLKEEGEERTDKHSKETNISKTLAVKRSTEVGQQFRRDMQSRKASPTLRWEILEFIYIESPEGRIDNIEKRETKHIYLYLIIQFQFRSVSQ